MIKHLTIASILGGIAISANADTFQFQFSGSGATATGSFTTSDTAAGTLAGAFNANANFGNISALNLTVAGASSGNGTFGLTDFTSWRFRSSGALNFSQNLAGQANFFDFNFFRHRITST